MEQEHAIITQAEVDRAYERGVKAASRDAINIGIELGKHDVDV